MKKCLIHIGMHKTGSTSIQESLNGFSNKNFYYANLGQSNHSVPIYVLFSKNWNGHFLLKGKPYEQIVQMKKETHENLISSIEKAKNRTLIISGEDIVSLTEDELSFFRNFLNDQGYQHIQIFAYVREPVEFISSAFQEILK